VIVMVFRHTIVNDIGILSSEDRWRSIKPHRFGQWGDGKPILQTSWSLEPGENKFRAIYPEVDWNVQLAYGEEIGMGTREYELVKI